ncbi:ABC transporter substrate-binding protein [Thiomicrorhabdus sediminis]|uniref:ABC transporter substrate binding protein n=1 Tax=Thiomicrorhabdus sediminis TaxID=2580412 RepID=A0A4P9K8X8_9GAMM|nr:hypothetical protein [Thiomicrorhabdus sediminis]QCU90876.1 hypothetical protein FE785_09670 [Thiomicrorhabdus sediminis]
MLSNATLTFSKNGDLNTTRQGIEITKFHLPTSGLAVLALIMLCLPWKTFADQQAPKTYDLPICAYVASYHPGYEWQDRITQGLQQSLDGKCHLKTFYMNSKSLKARRELMAVGEQAANFIKQSQAKVAIVSDDNAVRYVLQKHFKDDALPFVYCGVNHSGKRYGLPYKNTTGMVEKNPLEQLLRLIFTIQPAKTRTAMLTTQSNSANINVNAFIELARSLGIDYSVYQVSTQKQWQDAYLDIQYNPNIDILLFTNYQPIKDWDARANVELIENNNNILSLTMQHFMMDFNAIGMIKIPEEQGHWAGEAAMEILHGSRPDQIAVVPNEQFQLWVNPKLIRPYRTAKMDGIINQAIVFSPNETP